MLTTANGRWLIFLLLVLFGLITLAILYPAPAVGQSASRLPSLTARISKVYYRPQSGQQDEVPTNVSLPVHQGDTINVDNLGEALLRLENLYLLRIFRNSSLEAEVSANEASAFDQMRLRFGTVFNRQFPRRLAQKYLVISTDGAVIRDLGTEHLVYYDPQTQVTWLVVTEGSVQLEAAGQEVTVPAGWQTWVEPNLPPEPIRIASRAEIGNRFPLVDDLTNGALRDGDVLPVVTECTVNTSIGVPLNLRAGPGFQYRVINTMSSAATFGAIGRSENSSWVYGASLDGLGWAYAPYLGCDRDIPELPVQSFPSPTPTPLSTTFPNIPTPVETPPPGGGKFWCYAAPYDVDRGLKAGEKTTLYWKAEGANALFLDGESVPIEGQRVIAPMSRHTYNFRAVTAKGEQAFGCTIEVIKPPRPSSTPTTNITPRSTNTTTPTPIQTRSATVTPTSAPAPTSLQVTQEIHQPSDVGPGEQTNTLYYTNTVQYNYRGGDVILGKCGDAPGDFIVDDKIEVRVTGPSGRGRSTVIDFFTGQPVPPLQPRPPVNVTDLFESGDNTIVTRLIDLSGDWRGAPALCLFFSPSLPTSSGARRR